MLMQANTPNSANFRSTIWEAYPGKISLGTQRIKPDDPLLCVFTSHLTTYQSPGSPSFRCNRDFSNCRAPDKSFLSFP